MVRTRMGHDAGMALHYLTFDPSHDTDGLHTFDALASTSHTDHPAVMAEVRRVLDWAARQFPDGPGDLEEGCSWCHDLHTREEDGGWVTVSLSLSGTEAFAQAFSHAFGQAIGQGDDGA